MRAIQRLNHRLNVDVADEDAELVARVQAGMATTRLDAGPARRARGGGRLVRRRASAQALGERGVTAPPRAAADARDRILEAACDVIAAAGRSTTSGSPGSRPWRASRRRWSTTTSPRARRCSAEALEHSFELLGDLRTTHADDEGWTRRASGWAG